MNDQSITENLNLLVETAAISLVSLQPLDIDLPWRKFRTPYRIFLAEFLLVRTRTDIVASHYENVFREFPSIYDLAKSSESKIRESLRVFGLRKRAVILLKAAQYIVNEYGGDIPDDLTKLLLVPGLGSYTAVAILSFAFDLPNVPADVNILRFLSRLTGLEMVHKTKGSKELRKLLPFLSSQNGGPPAEVLLDFTRIICKPRNPLCIHCPINEICVSFQNSSSNT